MRSHECAAHNLKIGWWNFPCWQNYSMHLSNPVDCKPSRAMVHLQQTHILFILCSSITLRTVIRTDSKRGKKINYLNPIRIFRHILICTEFAYTTRQSFFNPRDSYSTFIRWLTSDIKFNQRLNYEITLTQRLISYIAFTRRLNLYSQTINFT